MNRQTQQLGATEHRPARVPSRSICLRGGAVGCLAAALLVFAEPVFAETVRLTAEIAAARAVEVSNLAAAAAERTAAARASATAADAATMPQLSASAAVARRSSVPEFELPIQLPGIGGLVLMPDITTTYATGVRAQQALYAGGAISDQRVAARDDLDAAEASRLATIADLRLAGQVAYWEEVRSSARVELAHAQEDRAQRLLTDTQALLDAGMAVNADLLAARERLASARVQVINADAGAANALDELRSLLNLAPDATIELADTLTGKLPDPPASSTELQQQALARRPELRASAAEIAALAARARVAGTPTKPSLGAVAQWDYNRPNQRYFPQLDEWKASWSVGLVASWTLFDGGKAASDSSATTAMQRAAEQERGELQRRIAVEVQTDARRAASALAAATAADVARAAAEERERAARERHAAGLAAMAEVLDAEAALAAAEQQQVDTRAAAWLAAATLARTVGQ
ncbi:MAG: TolC family protein [Thermoanaerobaculales bacterium]